jgi:hypothetical protein
MPLLCLLDALPNILEFRNLSKFHGDPPFKAKQTVKQANKSTTLKRLQPFYTRHGPFNAPTHLTHSQTTSKTNTCQDSPGHPAHLINGFDATKTASDKGPKTKATATPKKQHATPKQLAAPQQNHRKAHPEVINHYAPEKEIAQQHRAGNHQSGNFAPRDTTPVSLSMRQPTCFILAIRAFQLLAILQFPPLLQSKIPLSPLNILGVTVIVVTTLRTT